MKRNYARVSAIMLSVAMVFTMIPAVSIRANDVGDEFEKKMQTHAQIFSGEADQYKGKTVILHSNDVHGQIDGYAYIAELEDDFEEAGAEVITMDAGDFSQGDPNVSFYEGKSAITLMNAAGYEYSTLGNHEFDYGYDQLKSNLEESSFEVLCADILSDGEPVWTPHKVHTTKSGLKIGIFGMDTPETATKAKPSNIKGLTFLNNTEGKRDLFDCAQSQVDALDQEGADIVVALTHLGMDNESMGDGHRSVDMYNNVKGIDIILDGHSHDDMTEGPSNEPIQSTGTKFENIGVVVIDDASKTISDHYLVLAEGLDKDPEVEAEAKKIIADVEAAYGTVIGRSEVRFASEKKENRCYETNTGDLITDAMMWEVLGDEGILKVPADNAVVVINGGGIRDGLKVGDVTKKDIKAILPFGNTINIAYITGSQLLEVLEASTFCTPTAIAGYPQTKGIKFTIDTTKEYDKGELYKDSTYYSPASIKRVTIESINGKPFNENATYAVITNDFCTVGGDTYAAMTAADSITDLGFPVDEVISYYIEEELKGVLSAEKYGSSRGDVTIIKAPVVTTSSAATVTAYEAYVPFETDTAGTANYVYSVDGAGVLSAMTGSMEAQVGTNTIKLENLTPNTTYKMSITVTDNSERKNVSEPVYQTFTTLSAGSSSSGGGSSSGSGSTSKTTTTTNADGSKTTTTTTKSGTTTVVTETTKNKDGSSQVVKTVTKKDGSGTITDTKTTSSGTTASEAVVGTDGKVDTIKVTATNADKTDSDTAAYTATSAKALTLSSIETNKTSVSIPATVKVGGKTFKVTAIGKNALSGNKKLKKVTIGKNIKKIGANAFKGDSKLSTIAIKGKVTSVGKNAFKSINKKASVTIKASKKNYKKIKAAIKKQSGIPGTVKYSRVTK